MLFKHMELDEISNVNRDGLIRSGAGESGILEAR